MLNTLSLKAVKKRYQLTEDTLVESIINVHMDDGSILQFKEVESRLYLLSSSNKFTKQKVVLTRTSLWSKPTKVTLLEVSYTGLIWQGNSDRG